MSENSTKKWYESKSIWGGILAILAPILGALGYTIGEGDLDQLTSIITGLSASIGGILSIYGRVVASKSIK